MRHSISAFFILYRFRVHRFLLLLGGGFFIAAAAVALESWTVTSDRLEVPARGALRAQGNVTLTMPGGRLEAGDVRLRFPRRQALASREVLWRDDDYFVLTDWLGVEDAPPDAGRARVYDRLGALPAPATVPSDQLGRSLAATAPSDQLGRSLAATAGRP